MRPLSLAEPLVLAEGYRTECLNFGLKGSDLVRSSQDFLPELYVAGAPDPGPTSTTLVIYGRWFTHVSITVFQPTSYVIPTEAVTSRAKHAYAWRVSLEVLYKGKDKTLRGTPLILTLELPYPSSPYRYLLNYRSAFPANSDQLGTNGGCSLCRSNPVERP